MNKIEQTTLSIEDIDEHHKHLARQYGRLHWLSRKERLIAMDELTERFIHTFLEDLEL